MARLTLAPQRRRQLLKTAFSLTENLHRSRYKAVVSEKAISQQQFKVGTNSERRYWR